MTFKSIKGVFEVGILALALTVSVQASDKSEQMKRNVAAALSA